MELIWLGKAQKTNLKRLYVDTLKACVACQIIFLWVFEGQKKMIYSLKAEGGKHAPRTSIQAPG